MHQRIALRAAEANNELKRRGYSDGDIRKDHGDNFMRVFAEAEKVAKEMQAGK